LENFKARRPTNVAPITAIVSVKMIVGSILETYHDRLRIGSGCIVVLKK